MIIEFRQAAIEDAELLVNINGFEHSAVFIDPKAKPGDDKDAQIDEFCVGLG